MRPSRRVLPRDVRTQAGNDAEGDHLEHATDRLVRLALHVDVLDHRAARLGVQAADRVRVDGVEVGEAQRPAGRRGVHGADLDDVRADLDAERRQERAAQRAAGDARRRLARAGALEHVAHVGEVVLPDAHEIRMAGPRQVHLGDVGLDRVRVHPLLPVRVVAVGDLQGDRPAERRAVAHARRDERAIGLDLHPPAAAVAELPARHVAVDRLRGEPRPAGRPSTMHVRPGPCDSPAVMSLSAMRWRSG